MKMMNIWQRGCASLAPLCLDPPLGLTNTLLSSEESWIRPYSPAKPEAELIVVSVVDEVRRKVYPVHARQPIVVRERIVVARDDPGERRIVRQ